MIAMESMPDRIKTLPRDARGYPVPWFVDWIDGQPDFRVIEGRKMPIAVREKRCWICGDRLGQYLAFMIGPMCAVTRTISEPPSHRECAEFAAQVCPFLTLPKMGRNKMDLPAGIVPPAGVGLERNPGAVCLWITKRYALRRMSNGVLFTIGDPLETRWYARGRAATRAEVLESIDTGMPLLRPVAEQEGEAAVRELERRYQEVITTLVPA